MVLAVALAGCTNEPPPSPLASIPKLLVDFVDNQTLLYITSISADVRYDNLSLRLSNANLSAPERFNETRGYALIARTNLTYFALNATADRAGSFYFYNATAHIAQKPRTDPAVDPPYQIFIQESANGPIQQLALPFHHVLEEGRL
jgi:hypothetical protein